MSSCIVRADGNGHFVVQESVIDRLEDAWARLGDSHDVCSLAQSSLNRLKSSPVSIGILIDEEFGLDIEALSGVDHELRARSISAIDHTSTSLALSWVSAGS